jgi:DNA repair protein RadC
MKPYLYDEPVEHFYIILLDRNHQVLKIQKISSGSTNATMADPKLIFKKGLTTLPLESFWSTITDQETSTPPNRIGD